MTGAVVCNPSQPLRFISTASAGWGNRIGWLLTAAAIAEALNKSAIYTYWRPALLKGHCCNYDVAELHKLVSFPRVIRFLDREADFEPRRPWRLLEAVPTTTLPHPVKNAKNNLVRCSKGRSCAPPTVYSYRKALPKTTRHACLACLHLLSTSHAGVVASSRVLSRGLCLPCRRQRLHPRAGLDHVGRDGVRGLLPNVRCHSGHLPCQIPLGLRAVAAAHVCPACRAPVQHVRCLASLGDKGCCGLLATQRLM